jgi:hypothetical protein
MEFPFQLTISQMKLLDVPGFTLSTAKRKGTKEQNFRQPPKGKEAQKTMQWRAVLFRS